MAETNHTADAASLRGQNAPAFYPIQSSFTFARRERPPEVYVPAEEVSGGRVPLKQPKVHRRESKGGLRGMFTRNKTEKVPVAPVLEEPSSPKSLFQRPNNVMESTLPRSISIKRTGTAAESIPATPVTPGRPASRHSRINMRTKSVRHKTPVKPSPKSSKSTTKTSPKRPSPAWDPPPLFQAYPQSIKHAQLSASTLSADSILRISNHQRNNSLREEIAQVRPAEGVDQSVAAKKSEKARAKHRRQISGSISKAEWTQKIFVLVTSGYLLQYAGDGSFDRLPEKMMQLGKDSVAFASDVIPGKHWVLQISQAMDSDGTPASDSRSLLSRLAFRGADYRRTATSLLLVLNSAEEMDSWLAVVRREIEALGGKKHVSETGKPKPDDKVMQLKAQPSHRYLVRRDSDQFPDPSSPRLPSFGPPPWVKQKDNELQQKLEDAAAALAAPENDLARPLTGHQSLSHQSITNSITSHDEQQLESLRSSTNRYSYMSSGQRTLVTSNGSSPATSPSRDTFPSFDDFPSKISTEEVRPRPNAAAISERRRSMQTMHVPIFEAQQPPKTYRHSTYGGPARSVRGHSPATPNFSVPNSSSKRYSTTMKITATDTPPIPSIIKTTPGKSQDSVLNGTRKPAQTALNTTRPLSPVEDSSPSKLKSALKTSTASSLEPQEQARSFEIRPPPMTLPPIEDGPALPRPTASLKPLDSSEITPIDFQPPRRFSSMQTLRDDRQFDLPFRSFPLLPAEISTPLYSPQPTQEVEDEFAVHDVEREKPYPLPVIANTKSKMRRPNSMQVRTSSFANLNGDGSNSSTEYHIVPFQRLSGNQNTNTKDRSRPFSVTTTTSSGALNRDLASKPTSVVSPHLQRLKAESSKKALANRRSMPTLVNGPPPAPPPDCALPPLPPGSALRSPVSARN
ncbi:hypothetical protein NA56DRAFT_60970 [Hyaloscypha hepaticicola]|uniref:PH domain-containing protein n=1 Tax=Hyaloscypha hepaticicola TaxID=2082293 RepID=A0A2J6QA34_9HELO|nr:hypothetical protein NA56DRAFT_60970 [Hyaloscypha hepaticicola]